MDISTKLEPALSLSLSLDGTDAQWSPCHDSGLLGKGRGRPMKLILGAVNTHQSLCLRGGREKKVALLSNPKSAA